MQLYIAFYCNPNLEELGEIQRKREGEDKTKTKKREREMYTKNHYIYNKRVENNKFLSMMLSCELLCNMHELLERKSMISTSYKVSSYFCI